MVNDTGFARGWACRSVVVKIGAGLLQVGVVLRAFGWRDRLFWGTATRAIAVLIVIYEDSLLVAGVNVWVYQKLILPGPRLCQPHLLDLLLIRQWLLLWWRTLIVEELLIVLAIGKVSKSSGRECLSSLVRQFVRWLVQLWGSALNKRMLADQHFTMQWLFWQFYHAIRRFRWSHRRVQVTTPLMHERTLRSNGTLTVVGPSDLASWGLLEQGLLVDGQIRGFLIAWLVLNRVFPDPNLICWHHAGTSVGQLLGGLLIGGLWEVTAGLARGELSFIHW